MDITDAFGKVLRAIPRVQTRRPGLSRRFFGVVLVLHTDRSLDTVAVPKVRVPRAGSQWTACVRLSGPGVHF